MGTPKTTFMQASSTQPREQYQMPHLLYSHDRPVWLKQILGFFAFRTSSPRCAELLRKCLDEGAWQLAESLRCEDPVYSCISPRLAANASSEWVRLLRYSSNPQPVASNNSVEVLPGPGFLNQGAYVLIGGVQGLKRRSLWRLEKTNSRVGQ